MSLFITDIHIQYIYCNCSDIDIRIERRHVRDVIHGVDCGVECKFDDSSTTLQQCTQEVYKECIYMCTYIGTGHGQVSNVIHEMEC